MGVDAARVSWPPEWTERGVDFGPPDTEGLGASAWARVWIEEEPTGRVAGVARLSLTLDEDSSGAPSATVHARLYPAILTWTVGVVALVLGVVFAFASFGVALCIGAAVVTLWSYPAWSVIRDARRRLEPLLEHVSERLGAEP